MVSLHFNALMRFFFLALSILLVDQGVKQLVLKGLDAPLWFFSDQVGFQLVFNENIAFSLPLPGSASLVLSTLIVVGLLVYKHCYALKSFLVDLVFALVIAGALGNILDRLFYGAVIDFIRVFWWPIFNLADAFVVVGFGMMILFHPILFKKEAEVK